MKKIKLTKGKEAIVDDDDFKILSKQKWFFDGNYAARKSPKKVYMHRLVNKTPKGKYTDHINRNKLDNRKENLVTCSHAVNCRNRGPQSNNFSGVPGVVWYKRDNLWQAQIKHLGKNIYLGRFKEKEDAIRVRKQKEKELWS